MNWIITLCDGHGCKFHNLELHPQHGWIVRVSYLGVWGFGEDKLSEVKATEEAIRSARHLHATYHNRPQLIDLSEIDL